MTHQAIKTIRDLTPDDKNANKGTQRGSSLLEQSLEKYGAGRSILIDKNGRIIAGNKTVEGATSVGLEDIIVVQTDGTKLVAVQRTDLDLDDPKARELALNDNRIGELSLSWDAGVLENLASENVDLENLWASYELNVLFDKTGDSPQDHWQGMPEFDNSDGLSFRSIKVHFESQKDLEDFARLINQTITDKTRYLWFPFKEDTKLKDFTVGHES